MFICETILLCLTAYSMLSMYLNWKSSGNIPKTFLQDVMEYIEKEIEKENKKEE